MRRPRLMLKLRNRTELVREVHCRKTCGKKRGRGRRQRPQQLQDARSRSLCAADSAAIAQHIGRDGVCACASRPRGLACVQTP
mmetsp:Transcript_26670/g.54040  ORF Transcript_26670/g.54040 Transcript_26670/m.54040 type:complete len:83 (-) Transcript_26670:68-316(-)